MEIDGIRGGLVNSLESSLENSLGRENQHTDVLIERGNLEQHTEVLVEGSKALMPYDFCFNKYFVNVGIIAGVEGHLTQLSSQMKEKDENSVEISNPWNEDVMLLERMLNDQNSVEKESQFQNWELQMHRDEDRRKEYIMYQSSKLLIGEGKEEVFSCRKQEGMDDWVVVRNDKVRTETSIEARIQQVTVKIERVRTEQAVLAQQAARNQQLEDYWTRKLN